MATSLVIIGLVITTVVMRGAPALSWNFVSDESREAGAQGGIVYQLIGTILLIATAAVVSIPVATGVGLTHELYSSDSQRRVLNTTLQALNAVPSIVFGLFGLALFVQYFGFRKSWFAGGIVLAMMILPTLSLTFVERLRAIPRMTIEAATGLGLRRSQIARHVLLPQGISGLVTGTLLGLARAAGETAPIMFTAAIFSGATVPTGVVDSPVLALPYHIFVLAQDSFDPSSAGKMWGSATVLLFLVLLLSAVAIPIRMKMHEEARRA